MSVHDSGRFRKQYKKLGIALKKNAQASVHLLAQDEFHATLNNHKLQGKYEGCRSIDITGDWRVVYKKYAEGVFLLVAVGTHSELYE